MQHEIPAVSPDLLANNAGGIADALNALLADAFAIYVKTKNFHWHMSGPHFRDYHLLLDDQAGEILAITDQIAERVRKIGNKTLRSIGDIARRQRVRDNESGSVAVRDMLSELREDNAAFVVLLRQTKAAADQVGDNATSALIDEWTDQAERRAWFLFEAGQPG